MSFKILNDGPIGSGKTIFIKKYLQPYFESKGLMADLEIFDSAQRYFKTEHYDFLERAYNNPDQWALVVQHLFFNIFRENYDNVNHKFAVFSRTIESIHQIFNKTYFSEAKFNLKDFQFLQNVYEKERDHFKYDITVFFLADFDTLWYRLKAKNNNNCLLTKKICKKQYLYYLELLDQYLINDKIGKLFIVNTSKYSDVHEIENNAEEYDLTDEERKLISSKLATYKYSEPEEIISYLDTLNCFNNINIK